MLYMIPVERLFQSTLPRRERLREVLDVQISTLISIHAPAKGATTSAFAKLRQVLHFNPRSREGSDCFIAIISDYLDISIHAPAKGATLA